MARDSSDLCAQRTDLLRYVGRRVDDAALREDIVQEAYLRFFDYQAKPGNRVINAVALLRRISLNLARDYFRKTGSAAFAELPEDMPCPHTDIAAQAERRQLVDIVAGVLGRMPRLRRDVFIQRRLHGLSAKEAASHFNISPAAVDAHVARAVLDLHLAMERLEKGGTHVSG